MSSPLAPVRGTVDVLVLKALSWGTMHGFEVTTWLEQQSRGAIEVDDSALYQSLYRLEERGLVEADWGTTENNRRARYYQITANGKAHLQAESDRLLRYAETLSAVLLLSPQAS